MNLTPTQIELHEARKLRLARMGLRREARLTSGRFEELSQPASPRIRDWLIIDTTISEIVTPRKTALNLVADVARRHNIPMRDIMSHRKPRNVAIARHEAIYLVRHSFPDWSLPKIGRLFDRDHSSIIHAIRKAEQRLNANGEAVQ